MLVTTRFILLYEGLVQCPSRSPGREAIGVRVALCSGFGAPTALLRQVAVEVGAIIRRTMGLAAVLRSRHKQQCGHGRMPQPTHGSSALASAAQPRDDPRV